MKGNKTPQNPTRKERISRISCKQRNKCFKRKSYSCYLLSDGPRQGDLKANRNQETEERKGIPSILPKQNCWVQAETI